MEVSTIWEGQVLSAAELSTSSKQFTYASEVSMVSVAPVVGSVEGGTVVHVDSLTDLGRKSMGFDTIAGKKGSPHVPGL